MATYPGGLTATVPAVRTRALVRRFGDRTVLKDIDLDLAPGEFTALLGRSGSGKSTLLRAVAGLDHGVEGTGELRVPDRVSLSFQDSRLLPWLRVLDNVVLGLHGPGARRRGLTALEEVGLAGRERSWPHELSGGEQQRAALARALVHDPELLLADEPFGALDALTRIRMHDLLRELYERHRPAVLLVTHDVDEAVELADRVLVLEDGRISLDLAVGLPTPRSRRDPRFQEHRDTLLAALGVIQPDSPGTGAASPDHGRRDTGAHPTGRPVGRTPADDDPRHGLHEEKSHAPHA
ncbi:ABC transporter ATP-binding protein [Streptomyces abyssomicinicus]|uniref:ABC transporter ATP-binding protein n=1 Tax=Streptomyces abyssomicinicus TaxID=574929 RepID=UPI00124F94A9|nr:ABC transporter ATP-binding protein [Streptomyces abyssomicinicus]